MQAVPPLAYQKTLLHHWLLFTATDEMKILQWNPGSKTWSSSGAHDTMEKPLDTTGWIWVAAVDFPTIAQCMEARSR